MVGLLSLPDELIEHLGRGIICSNKCGRFRKWCRVASTCKQLWHMQLPGTTSEWFVIWIEISKVSPRRFVAAAQTRLAMHVPLTTMLAPAGIPWVLQRIQPVRTLTIYTSRTGARSPPNKMVEPEVLHHTAESMIRASQSFQDLTDLVGPLFSTHDSLQGTADL